MATKKRLSRIEFEAIHPFLRLSDERVMAARYALVEGIRYQWIADEFGWTKQAIGNLVRDVWKIVERYRESQRRILNSSESIPPGWEKVTLVTPSFLIPKFRAEIAEAIARPQNRTGVRCPICKKIPSRTRKNQAEKSGSLIVTDKVQGP